MRKYIEDQIEKWDINSLVEIDRELERIDNLITYYNFLITEKGISLDEKNNDNIRYKEKFRGELELARRLIIRRITWTLLNKTNV